MSATSAGGRYLCLHCWRALERPDAYFLCAACDDDVERPAWMRRSGGALRRLRDVRRPWWSRLFADDGGDQGPCIRHPEAPFQLFCECGYPLSERAAVRGAPLGLGIAGPRSSGKTLLVVTMMHELHGLELAGRPLGAVGLDDTESRFHELSAGFFDHGDKPYATAPVAAEVPPWDGEMPPGNFAWTLTVGGGRRGAPPALVAVNDLGGETWGLAGHERRERFDRYLGHLGSLIYLLDGSSMAADLGYEVEDAWDASPPPGDRGAKARQWFERITGRLGRRARRVDLALTVSKADSLWVHDDWEGLRPGGDEEGREALLERLLLDAMRRDVLIEARERFRNVRLFAVSSLGFLPDHGDVDGAGHLRRRAHPSGVTEPLVWLLGQRLPALR